MLSHVYCTILILICNEARWIQYDQTLTTSLYSNSSRESSQSNFYQFPTILSKNGFDVINDWKFLDFEYPSFDLRRKAIIERQYIPENNLPLGIDFYQNRIYITTPRWKDGVPASLGYVEYPPVEKSPAIKPYPYWSAHADPYKPDCSKLISVYRTFVDDCGRLWAIDSGIINATVKLNQICPPKILAFNLRTDEMIISYEIPSEMVKEDSLHSNIIADVQNGNCDDTYVYVTDVWRFGIVVYSLLKNRSWRVVNYNFSPNPKAADFNLQGINFQWLDGVFGMTISADSRGDKKLYFHPMASFKEFAVDIRILQNETLWVSVPLEVAQEFREIGDRGPMTQSSTSGIARNGVMFFTQVHLDNIGCWDTNKPYLRANIANLIPAKESFPEIQFPNDLKVDKEPNQGIWVMSNRLPTFLYSQLNYEEINFQILYANVEKIIWNTVCNPEETKQEADGLALVTLKEGQCY